MSIRGIDIASHQGPSFPFDTAAGQGFAFAIIKGAGGHGYQNEYRAAQVAGARAAGLDVGWYHYMFEPTSGGGDPDREAANFIAAIRPYAQPGDTLWLDVEEYPASVGYAGNLGDWIVRWCDLVEQAFGCVPGIYCATWYLQPTGLASDNRLTKYPFWMASWQAAPPTGAVLLPWSRIALWQNDAHYQGLTGADLDTDVFFGTRDELRALGIPGAVTAAVVPGSVQEVGTVQEPVADTIDSYINSKGETIVVWNAGGTATRVDGIAIGDLGVTVVNAAGEKYSRSVQANVMQAWVGPHPPQ